MTVDIYVFINNQLLVIPSGDHPRLNEMITQFGNPQVIRRDIDLSNPTNIIFLTPDRISEIEDAIEEHGFFEGIAPRPIVTELTN